MYFDLMNDPCLTLWRMYDKKKMYVNCMTEKKTNTGTKKTSSFYLEEDCACLMAERVIFEL